MGVYFDVRSACVQRSAPYSRSVSRLATTGLNFVGGDSRRHFSGCRLAIPISLGDGSPFPGRNEILILTFAVILATLVLQGLSLTHLLRWLNFETEAAESAEAQRARRAITGIALQYLASVQKGDEIHRRAVEQLQDTYRNRAEQFELRRQACPDTPEAVYLIELISLERKLIGIQRTALIELRDQGAISDAVLRRLQVLLDLEESELEEQERR